MTPPLPNDERDELPAELMGAVRTLRSGPAPSAGAVAGASAAAAAAFAHAQRGASGRRTPHTLVRLAWAASAVAAVGLGAAVVRKALPGDAVAVSAPAAPAVPADPARAPEATLSASGGAAAARALDDVPRLVRFQLRDPAARAVAVVGDFNRWDREAAPLARRGDVWEAVVPLTPGRHAYAFVVDGRRWVLDPAAPRGRDADFGGAHSVAIVGMAELP